MIRSRLKIKENQPEIVKYRIIDMFHKYWILEALLITVTTKSHIINHIPNFYSPLHPKTQIFKI